MDTLTVDLWTFDVGVPAATPEAFAAEMTRRVLQSWADGADVVVFPEYAWMGLERFVTSKDNKLAAVSDLFWTQLWPAIQRDLQPHGQGRAAVLGSVPHAASAGGGGEPILHNRVPILSDGQALHQDKLHLTPWERVFAPGDALHLWTLHGTTFAVVICLDIEVPELSVALRGQGVDCILVPSATENILGVERVGRCANARAVELCCHVGVSQIVGRTESELVDENVGCLAWFSPSQSTFMESTREIVSELHAEGFHVLRGQLDAKALTRARKRRAETNPALLTPPPRSCEIVRHALATVPTFTAPSQP